MLKIVHFAKFSPFHVKPPIKHFASWTKKAAKVAAAILNIQKSPACKKNQPLNQKINPKHKPLSGKSQLLQNGKSQLIYFQQNPLNWKKRMFVLIGKVFSVVFI